MNLFDKCALLLRNDYITFERPPFFPNGAINSSTESSKRIVGALLIRENVLKNAPCPSRPFLEIISSN